MYRNENIRLQKMNETKNKHLYSRLQLKQQESYINIYLM